MADRQDKPKMQIIDATHLVEKLELRQGVSAKTGNDYIFGVVYLKSSSTKGKLYSIDLAYLSDNDQIAIEDALESYKDKQRQEFSEDLK